MLAKNTLSFDEIESRLNKSLWFRSSYMNLMDDIGYRAPGHFGVRQGKRLSIHGFYEVLARAILAMMVKGKDCIDHNDFSGFSPQDTSDTSILLAVQYHLVSTDHKDLTPQDFWSQQGSVIISFSIFSDKTGVERMTLLSDLQKAFYIECESVPFDDIMELHMDLCRHLSDR
jgi:hypothetical protein